MLPGQLQRAANPHGGRAARLGISAMVALLAGCTAGPSGFKFKPTTAASFLQQVEEERDPNVRYAAYINLGSLRAYDDDAQKARAATLLASKLKDHKEPMATRAVICRTLGQLGRPEGREAVLRATTDVNEDPIVRAEACRALGRVGQSEDATVLAQVMTLDNAGECRIAAIESLGELKSTDRRITEYLVTAMENDDAAIRTASLTALREITGKDLGVDAVAWQKYVETLPKTQSPLATSDATVARTAATSAASATRRADRNRPGLPSARDGF